MKGTLNLSRAADWRPDSLWQRITTIDAHAEGEPLRVITGGIDPPPGATILEKRRYAQTHLDTLRQTLMFEPRGHADMYGALITEPVTSDGDLGVLFMHNEGWSTMCGHGIIGLTTVAIETGLIPIQDTVKFDTPAGRITARAIMQGDHVASVAFENVASFVLEHDAHIDVPGLGRVRFDIVFGGAFYAYVDAADINVELSAQDYRPLIEKGMAIKRAVMQSHAIQHPFESDLSFLYGVIFVGPPRSNDAHSRNVCVFAEGEVDRSPTGTGVSGRVALEYARGHLKENQPIVIESIIGSRFTAEVLRTEPFGPYTAVIPQVQGSAWITGRHEFLIDPTDPLKQGFILR
jgi:proline racemase